MRGRSLETAPGELRADVVVVGAGIAGLALADRLARRGVRVVVLESGAPQAGGEANALNEVIQTGDPYGGAVEGRFRGVGGTSTAWGGALLPFDPADLSIRPQGWDAAWPVAYAELTPYLEDVERLFALPKGPYDLGGHEPDLAMRHFSLRSPKWPVFAMRNVATAVERGGTPDALELWTDATVTAFRMDPAGRLTSVEARTLAGRKVIVGAPQFVLAAGAIESTRLLLLLDAAHGACISSRTSVLGRYFHDHLSAPFAEVLPRHREALNRAFSFRFVAGGMRSVRHELSAAARAAEDLPAAFVHVAFDSPAGSGFAALRDILQGVQRRRLPGPATWLQLGAALPWFARAVYWRFIHTRVLAPSGARFQSHLVIEQQPVPDNRITLAERRTDRFGCPLASIHWRVGSRDVESFARIAQLYAESWTSGLRARLGPIEPFPLDTIATALRQGGGVFHPGGSTRMSASSSDGVVDGHLQTHAIPNLHVAATSVFPTGGGANPTMMLIMMALRLADRLADVRLSRS